jgi:hypothetical protein
MLLDSIIGYKKIEIFSLSMEIASLIVQLKDSTTIRTQNKVITSAINWQRNIAAYCNMGSFYTDA